MITGRLSLLFAAIVLSLSPLLIQPAAAQTDAFVYAAVQGSPCGVDTPCVPAVQVHDAITARLVIRLPLPAGTTPAGLATSPDGAFVYVSNSKTIQDLPTQVIEGSITVIDARRHRVIGTFPAGENAGPIGVSGDGSKVVIATTTTFGTSAWKGTISVFDTASRAIVRSAGILPGVRHVEVSSDPEHVVVFGLDPTHFAFVYTSRLTSLDLSTLDVIATDVRQQHEPGGLALSRDRHRVHALYQSPFEPRSSRRVTFDAASLSVLSDYSAGAVATGPVELIGGTHLLAADDRTVRRFSLSSESSNDVATLAGSISDLSVPSGGSRAFALVKDGSETGGELLAGVDLGTGKVVHVQPLSTTPARLTSTPAEAQTCRYELDSNFLSFPVHGGQAQIRLTTTCDWEASSGQPWARLSTLSGAATTVIDVTLDPHVLAGHRTATLTIAGQVVTVTQAGAVFEPPFGVIDTPIEGTMNVSGAMAITGWALDDVGVARVHIYREGTAGERGLIYLGDAVFLEGARPDVAAAFPAAPFSSRSGWGLMILTNLLPNGGNGTFRLHAFAEDVEGNRSWLGSRTFTADNASAAVPFGALDTPGQGETISGVVLNWGWALTPGSATIPVDGTSIDVMIDGIFAGHPVYGLYRADIASLFPSYTNANSAVGYYVLDTRALENGRHTIWWIVRDNQGRAQGIGSRFFYVFNP